MIAFIGYIWVDDIETPTKRLLAKDFRPGTLIFIN